MPDRVQYASLLIRLWRMSDRNETGSAVRWQSEVEHIQSGKSWTFDSLEELGAFLQQNSDQESLSFIEIPEAGDVSQYAV